jgi:hypothetical protein
MAVGLRSRRPDRATPIRSVACGHRESAPPWPTGRPLSGRRRARAIAVQMTAGIVYARRIPAVEDALGSVYRTALSATGDEEALGTVARSPGVAQGLVLVDVSTLCAEGETGAVGVGGSARKGTPVRSNSVMRRGASLSRFSSRARRGVRT